MEVGYRCHQLYIEITGDCNLRCAFCCDAESYSNENEMTEDDIARLVVEARELGVSRVLLSGGEPLSRPGWHRIMARCRALGVDTSLFTNGTLVDDQAVEVLASCDSDVHVSLEGPIQPVHDRVRSDQSYHRALAGIRKLTAAGLGHRITLTMVVTRENYTEIGAFADLASREGIGGVRLLMLQNLGRARGPFYATCGLTLEQTKDALRAKTAAAGTHDSLRIDNLPFEGGHCGLLARPALLMPRVDPRGNVFLCLGFRDQDFSVGSCTTTGLGATLSGARANSLMGLVRERAARMESCRGCMWKDNACSGGCAASAQAHSGNLDSPDPLCGSRQYALATRLMDSVRCGAHGRQEHDTTATAGGVPFGLSGPRGGPN